MGLRLLILTDFRVFLPTDTHPFALSRALHPKGRGRCLSVRLRLCRANLRHRQAHQPMRCRHAIRPARGLPSSGESTVHPARPTSNHGEGSGLSACHRRPVLTAHHQVRADPISAFGGIVAFNRPVDEVLAKEIREFRYQSERFHGKDKHTPRDIRVIILAMHVFYPVPR